MFLRCVCCHVFSGNWHLAHPTMIDCIDYFHAELVALFVQCVCCCVLLCVAVRVAVDLVVL